MLNFFKRYKSNNSSFNSILKSTSKAFFIKLSNAVFGFLFNILLAKQIGAEGSGVYYLAFSVNTISILISEMGMRNVLLRFVASYSADKNWDGIKGIIQKTYLFSGVMAIIISVLIFFNSTLIASHFFNNLETASVIKYMSLAIFPTTLILLSSSILKGLERFKEGLIVGGLLVPLFGVPTMWILTSLYGVMGAVASLVIVSSLALLIAIYWVNKFLPSLNLYQSNFETKLMFTTGLPLFMIAVTNFIMAGGDVMFLGYWEEQEDVGVYGLAKRISALTAFILVAINSIVAPKFSKLYSQGKIEELKKVAQDSAKLLTFFAFPTLLFFLIFASIIMNFVGKDFSGGGNILIILAIGQFVNVITGSVGYLLMMCGFEKIMRNNIVIVSILTAILYVLLIPKYGIYGAALASAFGLATQNLIAFYLVKKKIGFWVFPKLNFKR